MNVSRDLAVMEELVRIWQEATDVNVNQDFWANTAKPVRFELFVLYQRFIFVSLVL